MSSRRRVVVVGAGFGGLAVARGLAGTDVDVTIIDKRNHHTFQPLLYQVATAGLDSDDICYVTRGIFHGSSNVRSLRAHVTGIDFVRKRVITKVGEPVEYDSLVLALGAVTADFGVPGVLEHGFGLKSAAEAVRIRDHVLTQFERAIRVGDQNNRAAATTVVIVGGGPTGVEMAGGFAELFERVLRRDFPELQGEPLRVVLVEGQDRLLGTFAPKLGKKAQKRLEGMGVEVRTNTQVAEIHPNSVAFSKGPALACNTVVWAAGVRAHPLAERLGLPTTPGGRVIVDEHLRLPTDASVFVIGDLAAAKQADGSLIPQVAAGAVQAGTYVAKFLQVEGAPVPPGSAFVYRDKGSMATIGRNAAVVEFPSGRTMSGFLGWIAWLGLHLVMLIGFRNRANVLVDWAWNYLTWDRASRIVLEPATEAAMTNG